jgi:hypothetical protein
MRGWPACSCWLERQRKATSKVQRKGAKNGQEEDIKSGRLIEEKLFQIFIFSFVSFLFPLRLCDELFAVSLAITCANRCGILGR